MSACLGLFSAVCFVVSAGESLAGGFAGRRLWCGFGFPLCCYIDLLILRTFCPCTEFCLLTHM